jgi:hypothetical protein
MSYEIILLEKKNSGNSRTLSIGNLLIGNYLLIIEIYLANSRIL